jgi:hypothetical protein
MSLKLDVAKVTYYRFSEAISASEPIRAFILLSIEGVM